MSLVWLPPVISSLLLFSCKGGSIVYLKSFLLSSSRTRGLALTRRFGPGCGFNNRSRSKATPSRPPLRGRESRAHVLRRLHLRSWAHAAHQQFKYINMIQSRKKSKSCPEGQLWWPWSSSPPLPPSAFYRSRAQKFKFSFSTAARPDVSGRGEVGRAGLSGSVEESEDIS